MAGGKAFAIVLARPDDQDFDILNINEGPGWVFDLQIVQVKEGKEEEFQELRKKVVSKARNIREVEKIFTFEVDWDLLVEEKERISYRSRANRYKGLSLMMSDD